MSVFLEKLQVLCLGKPYFLQSTDTWHLMEEIQIFNKVYSQISSTLQNVARIWTEGDKYKESVNIWPDECSEVCNTLAVSYVYLQSRCCQTGLLSSLNTATNCYKQNSATSPNTLPCTDFRAADISNSIPLCLPNGHMTSYVNSGRHHVSEWELACRNHCFVSWTGPPKTQNKKCFPH